MSNKIATFSKDNMSIQILSETNAVKNKIQIYAAHNNAVPKTGAVIMNDKTIATPANGINVYQIDDTATILQTKNFDFTSDDSAGNKGFVDFMNSQSGGYWLIVSSGDLKSSPVVDNWFASVYSTAWAGKRFIDQFPNSAYCAFYAGWHKKILKEDFYGNDGIVKEDSRAYLETVFDTMPDTGITGFPSRVFEDYESHTYSDNKEVRFPIGTQYIELSDYGIKSPYYMFFSFDTYSSTDLTATIVWLNSTGGVVSSNKISIKGKDNTWLRNETYATVPANATRLTFLVTPSSGTKSWIMRNLLSSQSTYIDKGTSISEFGVNGIRVYSSNENATSYLLELPDSRQVDKTIIPFINISEDSR